MLFLPLLGGQGSGHPNIAVCGRNQHPSAEFLWYQVARGDWWIIHVCFAYHLDHTCRTLCQ
jgi:hypothetical protein